MHEDVELIVLEAEEKMEKAIEFYEKQLHKIQTGRANPLILNSIQLECYGSMSKVNEIASISVHEGTQLVIKPFDISMNSKIVAAINNSSLGIDAVDEGSRARISFPEMTTEKRKTLVKQMTNDTENARIDIRLARQSANKDIKKLELPEDQERSSLEEVQRLTDRFILRVEEIEKNKEKDLLTI